MPDCLTKEERDRKLAQIAHSYTDLTETDIQILLDVSHALPSIGNLESGDTYINVLTRDGESMVAAQFRHPDCDRYKRDIIGEVEKKEDEPAVYRALEYGIPGSGSDTEPIRIINKEGKAAFFDSKIHQLISNLQEGFLIYDEAGICTFANVRAEEMYQKIGYQESIIGRRYEELELTENYSLKEIMDGGTWNIDS